MGIVHKSFTITGASQEELEEEKQRIIDELVNQYNISSLSDIRVEVIRGDLVYWSACPYNSTLDITLFEDTNGK